LSSEGERADAVWGVAFGWMSLLVA
jgi:hypothetical protein